MTTFEILYLALGSSGLLATLASVVLFGFKTGKIVQSIETLIENQKELKDELDEFKKETKDQFVSFKTEVKDEFCQYRKETKDELAKFENKINIFRQEVKEEFEKVRREIKSEAGSVVAEVLISREDIKRMQTDVSDIKERVSFMEAFMFFSEFSAESNNTRSESAKKMWERRKAKKVEVKAKE